MRIWYVNSDATCKENIIKYLVIRNIQLIFFWCFGNIAVDFEEVFSSFFVTSLTWLCRWLRYRVCVCVKFYRQHAVQEEKRTSAEGKCIQVICGSVISAVVVFCGVFIWVSVHSMMMLMINSLSCHSFTETRMNTHTRTHTHPFNDPFSRTPRVSRYQKGKTNQDFTEARDNEWQWHQLGHMQVCTSLQTDNHASTPPLSFLQAGCPSCHPTNSVKALKTIIYLVTWSYIILVLRLNIFAECGMSVTSQNGDRLNHTYCSYTVYNNIILCFLLSVSGLLTRPKCR